MLPNVPCTISKSENTLLTIEDGNDGAPLTLVPPTGNPGEQEWIVEHQSEDKITIRNLKYHDKYVGVTGDPGMNTSVVATPDPTEFTLEKTDGQHQYKLFVDYGGERVYLEMSMLRMYPPQVALLPQHLGGEPWTFRFLE